MASVDINGLISKTHENKESEICGDSDCSKYDSEDSRYDSKTLAYIESLVKEKHNLSTGTYPNASRLLDEGDFKLIQ